MACSASASAWRPVEIDGAAVLFALQGGGLEHLADGLLGQRLGVAGAGERFGQQVAVGDGALLVAQHDALVEGVEGLGQPLGGARRAVDAQGGLVGRSLQGGQAGLDPLAVGEGAVVATQADSKSAEAASESVAPRHRPRKQHEKGDSPDNEADSGHGPSAM